MICGDVNTHEIRIYLRSKVWRFKFTLYCVHVSIEVLSRSVLIMKWKVFRLKIAIILREIDSTQNIADFIDTNCTCMTTWWTFSFPTISWPDLQPLEQPYSQIHLRWCNILISLVSSVTISCLCELLNGSNFGDCIDFCSMENHFFIRYSAIVQSPFRTITLNEVKCRSNVSHDRLFHCLHSSVYTM